MKKTKLLSAILLTIVNIILIFIAFSINWALKTWNNLTMDEMIFHLKAPMQGTDSNLIQQFICFSIVPTIIWVLLTLIIPLLYKKKVCKILIECVVMFFFTFSLSRFWNRLDVGEYIISQNSDTSFIKEEYVNPLDVDISFPGNKRNLVYIYLESMETTYADKNSGGAFDNDYIPELTLLAQENEDFSGEDALLNGALTMPGTTWTMAALFAQTSGLPLQLPFDGNEMMDTQSEFFPYMINLGDILLNQGYKQKLLIGSDATFGGRRLYFSTHGQYDIFDYIYAKDNQKIPDDYYVFWGYEDEKMFSYAKEQLLELAEGTEPFNFTMLTVDTHFENGYVCEKCEEEFGDNQYANVIACSSKQLYEFVRWIQEQDFYDNTTIILAGDHLTMDSDFCMNISESYERKTYTCIINSSLEVVDPGKKRNYTTFDMFPTTLASLGAEIKGNRLGLGTNLFSDKETLSEQYGEAYLKEEVAKKSSFMESLARIDTTSETYLKKVFNFEDIKYDSQNKILDIIINKGYDVENFNRLEIDLWNSGDEDDTQTFCFKQENNIFKASVNLQEILVENNSMINSNLYMIDNKENRHSIGQIKNDLSIYIRLEDYLDELSNAQNYSIFIAAMDDATERITEDIQNKLYCLGVKESLIGKFRCSYYAVIDQGTVVEQIGWDKLHTSGVLKESKATYEITSAGYDCGNMCSIIIDGQEYSVNARGLNIVVYDNINQCVVNSVCYDTHGNEETVKLK